jgi:hypothetical protein
MSGVKELGALLQSLSQGSTQVAGEALRVQYVKRMMDLIRSANELTPEQKAGLIEALLTGSAKQPEDRREPGKKPDAGTGGETPASTPNKGGEPSSPQPTPPRQQPQLQRTMATGPKTRRLQFEFKLANGDPMPGDYEIYVEEKDPQNRTVKTYTNLISLEVKVSPRASDYVNVPADIRRADITIIGPIRVTPSAPPSLSPRPLDLRIRLRQQGVKLEGVSGFDVEQPVKEVSFEVSIVKEAGIEYAETKNREVSVDLKTEGEIKVVDVALTGGYKYTKGDTTTTTVGSNLTTTTKYTVLVIDNQKQPKLTAVQ